MGVYCLQTRVHKAPSLSSMYRLLLTDCAGTNEVQKSCFLESLCALASHCSWHIPVESITFAKEAAVSPTFRDRPFLRCIVYENVGFQGLFCHARKPETPTCHILPR